MKGIYPFGANIYQKLPILAIFSRCDFFALQAHIYKAKAVKFGVRVRNLPVTLSAKPNFVEIFKGVYPFLANLYDKLPMLTISGALSPRFKSHNGEISRNCADLGLPTPRQILCKSFKGIYPFGTNLYQRLPIAAFLQVPSSNSNITR